MLTVSPLFTANMSKITRPKLSAEVEFRQLTVGAAEDADFSAENESAVSQLEQLSNGESILKDYATLEAGRWLLDGSKDILPDDLEEVEQLGVWSEDVSLPDKTLDNALIVSVAFSSPISSVGLTVVFDTAQGQYAPSFTVRVYNGISLIETINATATSAVCVIEQPLDDYDGLEIEIGEWSAAGQRARIAQVLFGIVRIFRDTETVEFSVLRQIDPVNTTAPASELRFAFDNRDGKYDFENPDGIFSYVTRRQVVIARIGFGNELVQLGKFYTSDWSIDGGKVTMRSLDAISLLDVEFPDTGYTTRPYSEMAIDALEQAGITDYILDDSLSTLTGTAAFNGKKCIDVLKAVAVAARLTLYVDTAGRIVIGQLPIVPTSYVINYTNAPKPKLSLRKPLKSISVSYISGGETYVVSRSYEDFGEEISIADNNIIKSESLATDVLEWLESHYMRRKEYQSDWRQNPCVEAGDIIGVQTDYGTPNMTVISQQYTYSGGGLTGQTKGVGVDGMD